MTVAASPARYENCVVEPGTGNELAVAGAESGVDVAAEPESGVEVAAEPELGVLAAAELDDAEADTGTPPT